MSLRFQFVYVSSEQFSLGFTATVKLIISYNLNTKSFVSTHKLCFKREFSSKSFKLLRSNSIIYFLIDYVVSVRVIL